MMNDNELGVTLEAVLDDYAAASSAPSYDLLTEWAALYPQYAQELTDFTAQWERVEWTAPAKLQATDANELRELANALLLGKLGTLRVAQPVAILGIIAAARAAGLAPTEVARRAGLSVPLLTKLDRRLIAAASVPRQVVESLASALSAGADSVASYLQGPPLHAAANYMAKSAPSLPDAVSFADAVRADRMLSAEDRERLLGLVG